MPMFLQAVGEAVVAKGLGALKGFVPFGNVLYDVCADAIDRYRKANRHAQMVADAELLLKAEMNEVRAEAERIVRAVAKGESEEIIDLAVAYLTQMPGAIRQSLKRADDPFGTTIPAALNLNDAIQLSAVLPRRLPTFRAGDPVPHAPQWRFVELLGAGGFGEVWLAKHIHLNRQRAFKFCLDAASRARLMAHEMAVVDRVMEASKAVTDADHGIVPLLDCHIADDAAWLAYEYIDGGDLTAWARANALLAPPVRAANAVNMVRDLAGVVGHFHALPQPVIHRDLKPANVLLKNANGRWLLRVTDFGISHVGASAGLSRATASTPSMSLGDTFRGAHTPNYASPQQKRGERADVRDDVHALGIIALQLLLGDLGAERPSGNSWKKKLAGCDVPAETLDLLARCWDDDPDERPANGRELAELLASQSRHPGARVPSTGSLFLPTSSSAGSKSATNLSTESQEFVRMRCPNCSGSLKFPVTAAGKTGKCPKCQMQLALPSAEKLPSLSMRSKPTAATGLPAVERPTNEVPPSVPGNPAGRAGDRIELRLPDGSSMTFGWCPPGTFLMGSPESEVDRGEDERPHEVRLASGFYFGVCPITRSQFAQFVSQTGYKTTAEIEGGWWYKSGGFAQNIACQWRTPGYSQADDHPVAVVSWTDAKAFCDWFAGIVQLPARLPTECEWEYAARGGTTTPFHWGDELNGTQANCDGNYQYRASTAGPNCQGTSPVGSYAARFPHPWGLADMHGNVWEWCSDWYGKGEAASDRSARGPNRRKRVVRGGSWLNYPILCRAAFRGGLLPDRGLNIVGFRVVLPAAG